VAGYELSFINYSIPDMDLKQEGILKDSRILEKDLGRAWQGRLKYGHSLPSSQMT
jgi:hypothetical protein